MYQHNRLSVQPKLDWRLETDLANGAVKLFLINAGLGPAKVSRMRVVLDGIQVPIAGAEVCAALDTTLNTTGHDCFEMGDDDWIFLRPNATLTLYAANVTEPEALDALDDLRIGANYCSLYDQCETLE